MTDQPQRSKLSYSQSELLTTEQVAALLQMRVSTIQQWRWRGIGPSYARLGRTIRYRRSDVEAYIARRMANGTED
ncbi:hypothetical protein GMST_32680 [Geomonas silvestris]|uniref:Helix-turn-helix domain-containing protein n=2 Tax=Geomonas silvestris TaxID=2740184 RepID=A0A6V8MMJ1_9BACT|nr:hypothetical protein GMST_32680 [Geomonas silvestris]